MKKSHRLTRDERLRKQTDFERVYHRRCSAADEWLVVYGCLNDLPHARLGLSVGRKWGNSPSRNRVKRLYREAFRLSKDCLPAGMDYVLVPRKAAGLSLVQLMSSLPRLTQQVARRCQRGKASE